MPIVEKGSVVEASPNKKIFIIITIDYELPNSNHVDVRRYMINPIHTLLEELTDLDAKITIMAEMMEIFAMEREENHGFCKFLGYNAPEEIRRQLKQAISAGHDVQLHIHPQWHNASWLNNRWVLDYSNYRLPDLDYNHLVNILSNCKRDLEETLGPHCANYACMGIRAGYWNTQPSFKYITALMEAGFLSDSSVFKWGQRNNRFVRFDYSDAPSNIIPWYASQHDIVLESGKKTIVELPIYSEQANLLKMITVKRLLTSLQSMRTDLSIEFNQLNDSFNQKSYWEIILEYLTMIFKTRAMKFDYGKLNKPQMFRMLDNVFKKYSAEPAYKFVPINIMGHSYDIGSKKDLINFIRKSKKYFGDSLGFITYRNAISTIINDI